ncbi:acyl-CoA dehydrogenase family protein [Rossellomorea vietnamensis]|uniref:acyl-CoA dehydrogenase family protein n=1 Tax=Rossellomorea TaxID=2837508 RepID=UPI001CCF56A4|nr:MULTISPECIES: acyl-CoA dehydrogenase family protein [Rossellomorea]MCA0148275.1 acyl-CoA dehydrogenase family protein [Rossellomorea vietnamensis]UTE75721.1 acyl-CoA dehydrogenase family protein [Rossellomorea sp. KS-H15a]
MRKLENFYQEDPHLKEILESYLDKDFFTWADHELNTFGELCAGEIDERAVHTDREGQPKLIKYNRFGEEISEVWVNEGYKKTVEQTYNKGIVGYIHKEIPGLGTKGNYMYSYAQGYLLSQSEPGFYCPVTLSMATALLLERYASPDVKARFLPHVLSTGEVELYEGATFLTERQGGSDVGANETKALQDGESYQLWGEKYFASNSGMCGVTMVLARIEGSGKGTKGLSLFAVPWRNDDGSLNGIHIRRLKDKLGVRAVPSAEVEFKGANAYLVGEPDRGIYYMMEALNLSRICNAIASIGIMRRAYLEARNYAFHREAFGQPLAHFPMIKESLTRLASKQEVETSAVFHLVHLYDRVVSDDIPTTEEESVLHRLLIAILKKESAEQAIHFSHEAIELHGGNGYIEDFVLPRLLRDAQVLTVWEGTANILGLEVLRLMNKHRAHVYFLAKMKKELSLVPEEFILLTIPVTEGILKLEQLLTLVTTSNHDTQTYHAKRIAELMVHIFESVVALKDAYTFGGKRKRMIAEVFIEHTWKTTEWMDEEMKSVQYFDEIVGGKVMV